MKKTYIKPQTEIFELGTESIMLSASKIDINDGEATQWSNKKGGWSSDDWSSNAEVEGE